MIKNYKLANIFGKGQSAKDFSKVEDMHNVFADIGGPLHFTVTIEPDGWTAQCDEFEAITTGGTSLTPTDDEISQQIRDVIHTAFNIEVVDQSMKVINRNEIGATFTAPQTIKAECATA